MARRLGRRCQHSPANVGRGGWPVRSSSSSALRIRNQPGVAHGDLDTDADPGARGLVDPHGRQRAQHADFRIRRGADVQTGGVGLLDEGDDRARRGGRRCVGVSSTGECSERERREDAQWGFSGSRPGHGRTWGIAPGKAITTFSGG